MKTLNKNKVKNRNKSKNKMRNRNRSKSRNRNRKSKNLRKLFSNLLLNFKTLGQEETNCLKKNITKLNKKLMNKQIDCSWYQYRRMKTGQ